MRVPLPLRALATGALAFPLIAAMPMTGAVADPAPLVEVITTDPGAGATPPDYKLAYALREAEAKALAKPEVYGKPYVKWDTLYVPVVSASAQAEATEPIALPPDLSPPDDGTDDTSSAPSDTKDETAPAAPSALRATESAAPVPPKDEKQRLSATTAAAGNPYIITPKTPLVKYSLARLEAIRDEVMELTPDVLPGVDQVLSSWVVADRDQVVLESAVPSDALRAALASRYGADAVAILQVADPGPSGVDSRDHDSPSGGFWGGAWIRTNVTTKCTDAFSWRVGSASYMVTAGHCTTAGGWAATQVTSIGYVSNDTWANNSGSVRVNGVYRGDGSLIKLDAGKSSAATIYVGGVYSTVARPVGAMWSRRAAVGDRYCTGGATTGEQCGWTVASVGVTHRYSDGRTIRNAVRGVKQGQCTRPGDSGGPVYTVTSAGKVVAKGVHSGTRGGGSDGWGGALDPCHEYFTDIWDAYYAFPGQLATR
ncbi:hypothetical protein [Streptosporangium roseum]|uniref:hypothetical protein n=1 Tax=Streptosporangium roseum TaxID=2001 RepID=UPI0033189B28